MASLGIVPTLRRLSRWEGWRERRWMAPALVVVLHAAALLAMVRTEADWFGTILFLLTWCALNGFLIAIFRRPLIAAALSLTLVLVLLVLSSFKFWVIWTTINFLDFLIVNYDSIAFVLQMYPRLGVALAVGAVLAVPALVLIWWLDPFRIRRSAGLAAGVLCLLGGIAMSLAVPEQPHEPFQGVNHVSNFVRSGVSATSALTMKGWMEADRAASGVLPPEQQCRPSARPPHIILVLDEASFDITAAPGIKVPAGYADHFKSFDGKTRLLEVEGSGGPTWYTEYNVLTGLSARSFGRLKFYVTRIAAERVERGLPNALRRCGYKTFSLYPAYGAFLSAARFQATTGISNFIDQDKMGAGYVEPDRFYYDQALRLLARQSRETPLFLFVYTVANHFPWSEAYRPDDTPGWQPLGNAPDVDEYIRRQTMSARDYQDFLGRLRERFPGESFLVVRFGDHQPTFARRIIEPSADDAEIGRRVMSHDPRYYTTYYAVDAINFRPADLSAALDRLEAPYLPLVILEAAGLPLAPSFAEQRSILRRCKGIFYACAGGAEATRFNRQLIDAGLIKGMVTR